MRFEGGERWGIHLGAGGDVATKKRPPAKETLWDEIEAGSGTS
jgi:hypothetical protein